MPVPVSSLSDSLPRHAIIEACRDHVSCDLKGEAAILNLKDGVYYTLNPVGARVWALVQTPLAISAIQETLVTEYDVDAERCELDLHALLRDLRAHGLITIQPAVSA